MRTVKLFAIAIMLTLAGVAYAARATQDAPKPQDAKTAKSCCRKHEGKSCCGDSCSKEHQQKAAAVASEAKSCCGEDCCKAHAPDAKQATAQTVAAKDAGEAGCCSGTSCACCASKSGRKAHAAGR